MIAKIPNNFTVIKQASEVIEFQSRFHYWRAVQDRYNPDLYFLHHKYEIHDKYHIQYRKSMALQKIFKIVINHDSYFASHI